MRQDKIFDVVVVGGINTDFLARGPELPRPGDTVEGTDFQEAPGGKGANQAVAAARLGARVALVARVGTDARGDSALLQLGREGVDTSCVVRDAAAPTGAAVIAVDERGEKQILAVPGANHRLTEGGVAAAETVILGARVLLLQLEVPVEVVLAAARVARTGGARIVLDPAPPRPLPEAIFPLLDVIRPNAGEARALTGVAVADRESARAAARELLARGVGAAAVQAGDAGDLVVWGGGECWLPRLPVRSVDATGAGDAFAAALAVALAGAQSLEQAARFANAAAALATTRLGAQAGLPQRVEVERLLATARA